MPGFWGRTSLMAGKSVLELDKGVIAHRWKNTKGCWSVYNTDFFFPLATFYLLLKSRMIEFCSLGSGVHFWLPALLRKCSHLLSHLSGFTLVSETPVFAGHM